MALLDYIFPKQAAANREASENAENRYYNDINLQRNAEYTVILSDLENKHKQQQTENVVILIAIIAVAYFMFNN